MDLKQKPSIVIKGVKSKKMWAVFAPDGNLEFRTISSTMKGAQDKVMGNWADWRYYASMGYTTNKILVDIKLL